jgi:hypothetical protein
MNKGLRIAKPFFLILRSGGCQCSVIKGRKEKHMKEEFLEAEDLSDGFDIRFEIVRAKQRPNWSNIDEYLALMDEGLASIDDLVPVKGLADHLDQMELGHKTMMLLELHLQSPKKMSAEKVLKYLLSEYKK